MANKSKRRAERTERRRVMLKERKQAQRSHREQLRHTAPGRQPLLKIFESSPGSDGPGPMQLTDRVFELVPEAAREEALERCLRRLEQCQTIGEPPPGFQIRQTDRGGWQLVPPPEFKDPLVSAPTHALPEIAAAYAWEVAEGKLDFDGARQVANEVVMGLIDRGDLPSSETGDMMAKMLRLVIAGELLTGVHAAAAKFGHEFGM